METSPGAAEAASAGSAAALERFCQSCGYDLRGIEAERCPECGEKIEAALLESIIPWLHRRRMGWFRAYWKTVWLVVRGTRDLADEVNRPLRYRDALAFRRWTVAMAALPVVLAAAVAEARFGAGGGWNWTGFRGGFPPSMVYGLLLAPGSFVVSLVAMVLFLYAASGVPSWFFHPRRLPVVMQNRAIVLSYYGCAALALMSAPLLMAMGMVVLMVRYGRDGLGAAQGAFYWNDAFDEAHEVAIWLGVAVLGMWLGNVLALMRAVTGARWGRLLLAAVVIPVVWVVLGVGIFAGLHFVVSFIVLVLVSL